MKINLIKSSFYREKETKRKLEKFIRRAHFLSIGEKCADFERAFAQWQGRKYCIMFNSGSSANLALIQALRNLGRLKQNTGVGFSAITWPTNIMPLIELSLRPIPIDIETATLNVSLEQIKKVYREKKFSCLFLTNLLGFSDNIAAIRSFCKERNILLLEDNCESLGSEYDGQKLGNFGLASTFSFFVGHHLSTIEGGAVCTDDKELAVSLRMVRSHGWDRHLPIKEQRKLRGKYRISDFYAKYTFYDLAYNIRPTEIQGFLGLEQLKYIEEMIDKRERNYRTLETVYRNDNFLPIKDMMSRNSNFAFPIICKTKEAQRYYLQRCSAANIETRPIAGSLATDQPFYRKYDKKNYHLPNARFVKEHSFYVGNNPEMRGGELSRIMRALAPKRKISYVVRNK